MPFCAPAGGQVEIPMAVTGRKGWLRAALRVVALALPLAAGSALAQEPDGAETDWQAGFEAERDGDWDGALDHYNRAIQSGELSQKRLARVFRSRGNVNHALSQDNEALQDYETAIRLDPLYANAYVSRGVIYHLRGDYLRAIEDYDEALRLEPDNALAYANRGGALEQLDHLEAAISDFRTAYRLGLDKDWLVEVLTAYDALPARAP